ARLRVYELWGEVAHPLALRDAVHFVDQRLGEDLAQAACEFIRKGRRRIGDAPDRRKGEGGAPVGGEERGKNGGDAGEYRDPLLAHALQHLAEESEGALQHQAGPQGDRHEELVKAVVERERQYTEDPLVLGEAQILDQ